MSPRWGLPLLFLLVALPTCLFLALLVPFAEVPDEMAHLLRADSLRHGELLGKRRPTHDTLGNVVPDAGVRANIGLLETGFAFYPGTDFAHKKLTQARRDKLLGKRWAVLPEFISTPNTAPYMPLLYLPAALALRFGQAAGLAPFGAIIAARLAMAATYLLGGFAALALARRGRVLMFAVLCLPMSLSVAASVNPDGVLLACVALAAALLTRPIDAGNGRRGHVLAGILLALALALKPGYLPLAAIMALPALEAPGLRRHWPRALRDVVATALPAIIWGAVAFWRTSVSFITPAPYHPGPLAPGAVAQTLRTTTAPALQLRILLHPPTRLFSIPWHTLGQDWWLRLREMVGVLGTLDMLLPPWLTQLWLYALGAAILAELLRPAAGTQRHALARSALGLAAIIAALWGIHILQYISWTLVGLDQVQGVQGRYFLPLLAMLAICLPALGPPGVRIFAPLRAALAVPAMVAALVGLALLPALVVTSYYLR